MSSLSVVESLLAIQGQLGRQHLKLLRFQKVDFALPILLPPLEILHRCQDSCLLSDEVVDIEAGGDVADSGRLRVVGARSSLNVGRYLGWGEALTFAVDDSFWAIDDPCSRRTENAAASL